MKTSILSTITLLLITVPLVAEGSNKINCIDLTGQWTGTCTYLDYGEVRPGYKQFKQKDCTDLYAGNYYGLKFDTVFGEQWHGRLEDNTMFYDISRLYEWNDDQSEVALTERFESGNVPTNTTNEFYHLYNTKVFFSFEGDRLKSFETTHYVHDYSGHYSEGDVQIECLYQRD